MDGIEDKNIKSYSDVARKYLFNINKTIF